MSGVGLKATYRFAGEEVHAFESFPSAAEASNEYATAAGEEKTNHAFGGKMDGGVALPQLKNDGPYAALVTAIKVRTAMANIDRQLEVLDYRTERYTTCVWDSEQRRTARRS